MSTLNNKTIYATTPYIQNQLIYNLPLQVYSKDGTTLTNDVKVQPYKADSNGLMVLVGSELIQNTDFSVSINSTANGIIITLFKNIIDARFLEVYRYTNPESTSEYQNPIESTSLKEDLDIDITNAFNASQEHEKLIRATRVQVSKYSSIINGYTSQIANINRELTKIPKTASELPAVPNLGLTGTNTQAQLNELKTAIDEARQGTTIRKASRVATTLNINLINVSVVDGVTLILNDRVLVKNQTNLGENGIYFFDGSTSLIRSEDANTLSKLAGSRIQVLEGTSSKKEFNCIVNNINGILNIEACIIEEAFNSIADNQVELKNLAPQPAGTFIGNITDVTSNPTYVNKPNLRIFLSVNNVDNTSDENKPVSNLTLVALSLKANQVDLDALSQVVAELDANFLLLVSSKQDVIPIGGNNDYVGFTDGVLEVKTLTKELVGLGNVDNTRDVDKPVSNPQKLVFDKCFQDRGNLENYNINNSFANCLNLLSGSYYITSTFLSEITDKPAEVQNGSTGSLILYNLYIGEVKVAQIQKLIEITSTDTFIYIRTRIISASNFGNWNRVAYNSQISDLKTQIQNIIVGQLKDVYVPQSQHESDLALKQDLLPEGTVNEYLRGDKTVGFLSTDAVSEGTNPLRVYHTQARVRQTTLTGYAQNSTPIVPTDTILQALGKLAQKATTYTKIEIDNVLIAYKNPTDLGEIKIYKYYSGDTIPTTKTFSNGITAYLFNGQTLLESQAPVLFADRGWSGSVILENREGRVSIQVGGSYNIGSMEGSTINQLTANNMPTNIEYRFFVSNGNGNNVSGLGNSGIAGAGILTGSKYHSAINGDGTKLISTNAGNQPISIMQPYIVDAFYLLGW